MKLLLKHSDQNLLQKYFHILNIKGEKNIIFLFEIRIEFEASNSVSIKIRLAIKVEIRVRFDEFK